MSDPKRDLLGIVLLGLPVLGGCLGAALLIADAMPVFLASRFGGASPYGTLFHEDMASAVRLFSVFCVLCGVCAGLSLIFPERMWKFGERIREWITSPRRNKRHVMGFALLLILFAAITYSGAFRIGFHSDDFAWLDSTAKTVQNPAHIFSRSQSHFFRPLTFLYHTINYSLFRGNPHLQHISGIVFHGLAGFFVFLIVVKLSGRRILAGLAALLFCAYPVSSRSVMWISGSEIVFAGLIYLLAFYLFLLYLEQKKPAYYAASFVLFVLGLMAKEAVISLAAAVFLAGFLFPKKASRWSGLPFVIIGVAFLLVQMSIQSDSFLLDDNIYVLNPDLMIQNYGGYAFASVIPLGHRILYFHPVLKGLSLVALAVCVPLALIFGGNLFRFLVLWHIVLLAPFVAFNLPVQPRYLYLPSLALSILLALTLGTLWTKVFALSHYRQLALAAGFCLLVASALVQIHTAAVKMRFESIRMNAYIQDVKSDPQKMRAIKDGRLPADSPLTLDHLKAALKLEPLP